jgi:hypothetical protein
LLSEQKNCSLADSAMICFTHTDSEEPWVAIPLGKPANGGKVTPGVLPHDLLAAQLELWNRLPRDDLDNGEIRQEIMRLGETMSNSHTVVISHPVLSADAPKTSDVADASTDRCLWWLVPTAPFRPICSLIHQSGPPPPEVIRDWEHQFREKTSPTFFSIVSPTGWVIDLAEMVYALRSQHEVTDPVGLEKAISALKIPRATVVWPLWNDSVSMGASAVSSLQQPDSEAKIEKPVQDFAALQSALKSTPRKPATRRSSGKPKHYSRLWISAATAALCVGFLTFWLVAGGADRSDRSDRSDRTDQSDQSDNIALEATEIAPVSEQEMELPTLDAIDGHSLANTLADVKPMVQTLMLPQPSDETSTEDPALPVDIAGEPTDDAVDIADNIEAPVDGQTPANRVVQEHLDIDSWGTRREVRFGRGVNSKNGLCSATFKLNADNIKDIVILQEKIQTITGNGMCEWRIAKEDEEGELVVRVFSKPAPKWLWMIQVGARTNFGAEPVSIAPGEAMLIINRLRAHSNWLIESLDALQAGPQRPRVKGMPDPGSYSRWLRSQERETDRAIRQWTTIAELCDILTASGKIDLSFSVNSVDPENMSKEKINK